MIRVPAHRFVVFPPGLNRYSGFLSQLSILCFTLSPGLAQADSLTPERQRELVHLVRQDCGSCHGMTLQGGLGPSLKPEALRDKPFDSLVAVIYSGRPGTPMPPWQRFMTETEAAWIVEQLMKGFPNP